MRLLKLELVAFGPFSGLALDFTGDGLHVVYGKNEAGKSTALRAITGLLYGIPKSTEDAHLHKMADLRVGGVLGARDGTLLSVVRRKGREHTLLDRGGHPLEDSVLSRFLGGISQEQFLTMFGLDHITLRRGGQALLLGKGNAAEGLFGAAMAGGELHKVLRSLRAEADALFSAKAHSRPLNEALRAFAEAQRQTRELSTSPESVLAQTRALEELKSERQKCESDRQRLRLERAQLERMLRVLPRKARRRALAERRRALGEVPMLATDAGMVRIEQERNLAAAAAEAERVDRELSELRKRRSLLSVPESLVAEADIPVDLAHRLGAHQKAGRDLPRIEAEIGELEAQARTILRKTGPEHALDAAEARRVDAPTQARIRQLALEAAGLAQARRDTGRALLQKQARLAAVREALGRLAPLADVVALKKSASRAEREGPLEKQLAELSLRVAELETGASAQLSSLGLGGWPLARAAGLPLPSVEIVEQFLRKQEELVRDVESALAESTALLGRLGQLRQDIDAHERTGRVPTEQDLQGAREKRDDTFRTIAAELGAERRALDRAATILRYEDEVRQADLLSDRLRREAERASRLAALSAERDAAVQKQAAAGERARTLARAQAAESQAFRELFRPAGVDPGPPSDVRGWLARHTALTQTFAQLESLRRETASLTASIERHKDSLRSLLEPHGPPLPSSSGLEALLDRATAAIAAVEALRTERSRLERDGEELEAQVSELAAAAVEHEGKEAAQRAAWRAAIAPLGLGEERTPAEVTVMLDLLGEALHKMDEAEGARRRALVIEREARAFARDVRALAQQHAPDLADLEAPQAAAQIIQRALRAQAALAERRELDRQIEQGTARLAGAREREHAAVGRLTELMREAHVDSVDALELAEQRSEEARRFEEQIAELDGELALLGEAALSGELDAAPVEAVAARLEEVEAELGVLEQRASVIHQRFGSYEAGLERLARSDASAADAAVEAQTALARVRELAARYARARVAATVLDREIEGYRLLHQGPVLARASELFRRMTLGSFVELRTEYDEEDQPVLRGARADGSLVGVLGMSEGTRDQLYFALRLATLERHAALNEPVPVVLDDVLIHFDDERARAAIGALAELSRRTQVLFFTHHTRLVELAEAVGATTAVFVHELAAPRAPEEPLLSISRLD